MSTIEVDRLVAVDWSGDKGPGQKKKIWAGVWTRSNQTRSNQTRSNQTRSNQTRSNQTRSGRGRVAGGTVTLETGRTRAQLTEWLTTMARQTPRMVVSVDCCFSYPAWFLREHQCATVFDFWRHVASGHGERWLCDATDTRDQRFWGKPHKRPAIFSGAGYASMMRATDWENKVEFGGGDEARAALMRGITPKSPFQIGGSGSVGTGSLRAMEWLERLHQAGFRVWPFEDAELSDEAGAPLLVEMYTRLLTGPVAKSNEVARRAYLKRRGAEDPTLYGTLPRSVVAGARASEDGFDALVCCLEMVRWQAEFASLRATTDERLKLEGITWRPGVNGGPE